MLLFNVRICILAFKKWVRLNMPHKRDSRLEWVCKSYLAHHACTNMESIHGYRYHLLYLVVFCLAL